MGTGAEVLGVVQTSHLVRAAGTSDARQVAGGPTLAALPLLIREQLIINLSGPHHALETDIQTSESRAKSGVCAAGTASSTLPLMCSIKRVGYQSGTSVNVSLTFF